MADKQVVFPSQCNDSESTLGAIVVKGDPSVTEEEFESRALSDRVSEGFAKRALRQDARMQGSGPMKEVIDNGLASLSPQLEMFWGPHDLDGRCFMLHAEERAELADADVGIIALGRAGLIQLAAQVGSVRKFV